MRFRVSAAAALAAVLLIAPPAPAQNLLVQDGWQGFAVRTPEGKFDRCVLYNRTVAAINTAPYDMLGLTRDDQGVLGLMVFYQPRTLTRGHQEPVNVKIDQREPASLTGEVKSDFHVVIAGPLPADTQSALRTASAIEVTVEGKTFKTAVSNVGAVIDRLAQCTASQAK